MVIKKLKEIEKMWRLRAMREITRLGEKKRGISSRERKAERSREMRGTMRDWEGERQKNLLIACSITGSGMTREPRLLGEGRKREKMKP